MVNGIKLYFKYVSVSIQSQMQYRASFIMMTFSQFIITFVDFLGVWILFDRFGALKQWSMAEVALFYGIVHIAFAISEGFARGFDTFSKQVKAGDFDRILLRPRSTVLQVLGLEFQLMRLGRLTQGLVVLLWAVNNLSIHWNIVKLTLLIAAVLGGACLFSGIFVLQATLCFWSVESLELVNMVTYGGVETAQYPISIYSSWFRKFFIFVIPLACINYFPAMGILEKADPLNSPVWVHYGSPLVGLIFLLLSFQVWKFGVTHYRSTGS